MRLTFFSGRVDRSGQLGVRVGGLGGDDDLGSILGGLQGDGLTDAAAGAGDQHGLAGKFSGTWFDLENSTQLKL